MPIMFIIGHAVDNSTNLMAGLLGFDGFLAVLFFVVMFSFKSLEANLLLLFAFIGQYYMLHSIDLLGFYVALEAQNFCFLVLCGLPGHILGSPTGLGAARHKQAATRARGPGAGTPHTPALSAGLQIKQVRKKTAGSDNHGFSVEASLKYFLLSAFSSGVILFWFGVLYLQTGNTTLSSLSLWGGGTETAYTYLILCALMFKLGAAPLHLWSVQIYNGVTRQLLMYVSTAPKLALFGF
jgi:NADH:ubiquinone oxidoreductase subunit 2 (subunit N)